MTAFRNDCLTTTRNGASISKCNWLKDNIRETAVPLKLQHGVHISALIDTPLFNHYKYRQKTDKRRWLNLGTLFAGLEASEQSRCKLPQRSSTISLPRSKLLVLLLSFNRKAEKLKRPSLGTNCALKLNFSAHKPKKTTRPEQPRTSVSTPTSSKFKLKLADSKLASESPRNSRTSNLENRNPPLPASLPAWLLR